MSTWFIAGTDTDVGKTVFTGLFARELSEQKRRVITQKWVQTGCDPTSVAPDIQVHQALMEQSEADSLDIQKARCPYQFKTPASAHLAAEIDQAKVKIPRLTASLKYLQERFDDVIVEGLGGLMVPLTAELTALDLVEQLKLTTILVVKNRVGAINHALLSLEALASRHVPIEGFVMNNMDTVLDPRIAEDNMRIIETRSGVRLMGTLSSPKAWIRR